MINIFLEVLQFFFFQIQTIQTTLKRVWIYGCRFFVQYYAQQFENVKCVRQNRTMHVQQKKCYNIQMFGYIWKWIQ